MRSSDEIKEFILDIAGHDDRIRAVLLNGSRSNSKIMADEYQDFDIVFIVTDLTGFTREWTKIFGKTLITQCPDDMDLNGLATASGVSIHYLMLLTDGNRIDLTVMPLQETEHRFLPESLTLVWLDKDGLFAQLPKPNDSDHHIRTPGPKEFTDTCNEFWWVCTNVARGLCRREVTYAKYMMEGFVRPMFMRTVEWWIGAKNGFSVSFGKGGKFMMKYLSQNVSSEILHTYSDYGIENNWRALFIMMKLFGRLATDVAGMLSFQYNSDEAANVTGYIEGLYRDRKMKDSTRES